MCIRDSYNTVTKTVVKTPATTRTETIPAEYNTVTKTVVKTPPSTREEIIPAVYNTVTKTVVKTPPSTRTESIPAEYQTLTRTVVKSPATSRTEAIPAEYETITKKVVKSAATTNSVNIPAEYATITKNVLRKKGGFTEWREVLCENQVTNYTISQIQNALISRGYSLPKYGADNDFGTETKEALKKFQRDNGLPIGNLDFETLKALGVQY